MSSRPHNICLGMMRMNDAKRQSFATAVAQVRHLEKGLLGDRAIEEMLASRDVAHIETLLRESGYENIGRSTLNRLNFDALLRDAMELFAAQLLDITPDRGILDLLFLEHDIYNIKALLMREDAEVSFDGDLVRIPADRSARYRLLAQTADIAHEDWADQLFLQAQALYREGGSKAMQEWLDQYYHQQLLQIAKGCGVPVCIAYAQAKIDFYNILCVLRIQRIAEHQPTDVQDEQIQALYSRILIDGGTIAPDTVMQLHKMSVPQMMLLFDGTLYRQYLMNGIHAYSFSQDISFLEKCMDDYLTSLMRKDQFIALGPEPLLGYLHGRWIEAMNIRLILTSVFWDIPSQVVSERLRDSYA